MCESSRESPLPRGTVWWMTVRPAVPNVMKLELIWTRDPGGSGAQEQWYVNTIYTLHAGTCTQAMADADYAALRTWATNFWRARTHQSIKLREIKGYGLDTVPPTKFVPDTVYPGTTIQGTDVADVIAWQVSPVISLRTGTVGQVPKPPRSRLYHTGLTRGQTDTSTGYLTSTAVTNYTNAYTALITAMSGVGSIGDLCMVSYWLGGTRAAPVLRGSPLVLPITHVLVPASPGSLHTRRARQQSYTFN